MKHRALFAAVVVVLLAGSVSAQAEHPLPGGHGSGTGAVRAGVATSDISWHVGASQGQYGSSGTIASTNKFDPYGHSTKRAPSDGIQGRLLAHAIVVEGPDGERVAYVKHDLYLQQDLLHRRVAQLVEQAGTRIDRERLMIGGTHNHSAPYFATTSFGVWLFTDMFDYRQFDYVARGLADAVIRASKSLRPVRMGASVVKLDEVQHNILGPRTADDGTPAGFPRDHFDDELAVVRFDDVSGAEPKPYAALVNLGMHPESLASSDMYSPDFVGMVERMAGRATGATVVWSQGSIGDVEPDQNGRANPPSEQKEYWHRDFAQAEKMSRIVAARVIDAFHDVASDTHEVPQKHVPFETVFPVSMRDETFAGPASHPLPTYGNCRTDPLTEQGRVRVPGVPTCEQQAIPVPPGVALDPLRDAGVPVPDQYAWTGFGGVQETLRIHLQVMRLGDVTLGTCPCEPISDMTKNFKSRVDAVEDNIYDGFDWPCTVGATTATCDYRTAAYKPADLRTIPLALYRKMHAQIHNDARGWEAVENIGTAEAEPSDPARIRGNFTKEEITDRGAADGYTLPLMVGIANDYLGYIVTYREYQSGDHYRKALTAFGPHTADYFNTRLVRMAAALRGGEGPDDSLLDTALQAEDAALLAKLEAAGRAATEARAVYEAALPDDGGTPAVTTQPVSLERFGAAQVRWTGGGNYTDNPLVRVERLVDGEWRTFATQEGGEVIVTIAYPPVDASSAANWATAQARTTWTATFEAFEQTPAGTYRFVIDGAIRKSRAPVAYHLTSNVFEVKPWSGIEIRATSFGSSGEGTLEATIAYPRTYTPVGVPYISTRITKTDTGEYCLRCTFRPWASSGTLASLRVRVVRDGETVAVHDAVRDGGRWRVAGVTWEPGDDVLVAPGDAVDEHGNVNGETTHLVD